MYKRAVLDLEETQVMDELLAIMQRFEGWGLRANVLEMTAAIHTLQSFVVQHMLARIEPSLWSDWYITAGKGERSRANIRMEHILEPATPVSPTAPSARPRITADEPRKKPAPVKAGMVLKGISTTKAGSMLRASIKVRRAGQASTDRPGFSETDLVAHCGRLRVGSTPTR